MARKPVGFDAPVDIAFPASDPIPGIGDELAIPILDVGKPPADAFPGLIVFGSVDVAFIGEIISATGPSIVVRALAPIETSDHMTRRPALELAGFAERAPTAPAAVVTKSNKLHDPHARALAVDARGLGTLAFLASVPDLQELWLSHINEDQLSVLADLRGLRLLSVASRQLTSLDALTATPDLEALILQDASKLTNIDALGALTALRRLRFNNVPTITSLEPLRPLVNLRAFRANTLSSSTSVQLVDNLDPLAELQSLEAISMPAWAARDRRLEPLLPLPNLRHILIPNHYPLDQYAQLWVHKPELQGFGSHPLVAYGACRTCNRGRSIQLIGGRPRHACTTCSPKPIRKFISACTAERLKVLDGRRT